MAENVKPVYSNTSGTSKPNFKLGRRGIELSTSIAVDKFSAETVKKLLIDGKAVQTEDRIVISDSCITSFIPSSDGKQFNLSYKYFDSQGKLHSDTVTVYTSRNPNTAGGDMFGPESSVSDNIPVFQDNDGKKIKDSGYRILSEISNSVNESKEIPTVALVKEFIGLAQEPLEERRKGIN